MKINTSIEKDNAIIDAHGGTVALAGRLGITPPRVNNWRTRGVPASARLEWPEIFLPKRAPAVAKVKAKPAAKPAAKPGRFFPPKAKKTNG